MNHLRKMSAFIRRDFLIESSYKVAFVMQIISTLLPLFSFYFIAKLVPTDHASPLQRYGGNYFEFVLIGIGMGNYLIVILRAFGNVVRRSQTSGVLEVTLSTETSPQAIILYSAFYTLLTAFLQLLTLFWAAWALLGVSFGRADVVSTAVTMLLTMASFTALGILSATAVVILKRGDPVEFIAGAATTILAGAYFPVDLLPDWLRALSKLLPITYALDAMRQAMFQGLSVIELRYSLGVLAVMSLVLMPISLALFARAVERGRRDGSLSRY
jgi:ABC-2 type transport system permease protein